MKTEISVTGNGELLIRVTHGSEYVYDVVKTYEAAQKIIPELQLKLQQAIDLKARIQAELLGPTKSELNQVI